MDAAAPLLGGLFVFAVAAFLIGSIPFGYVIGRFIFSTDIRKRGSGNIGAMNALRTLGKGGAIAVLVLDAAKGFLPAFLALVVIDGHLKVDGRFADFGPLVASTGAVAAILGHCFSPWLGWKGGKGVATSIGAIFALSWKAGLAVIAAYLAGALAITQYSSVGSMLGSAVAPFALWFFTGSLPEALYGVFAALLIIWTHRENIGRLRAGTESPIGIFRKDS
ncbi:MAG: glycerol-3-phosphate 1-O-acyltransferase PlsY [Candidatus Baltobacteraceae bacterium]